MSIRTMVGTLSLVESISCEILARQEPPDLQICTTQQVRINQCIAVSARYTFVEDGQDSFDVGGDLRRRRLPQAEVALRYSAGACSCRKRGGKCLPPNMLIVGPPVNVDYIAGAMFHGLQRSCGDQLELVFRLTWSLPRGREVQLCYRKTGEVVFR